MFRQITLTFSIKRNIHKKTLNYIKTNISLLLFLYVGKVAYTLRFKCPYIIIEEAIPITTKSFRTLRNIFLNSYTCKFYLMLIY